MPNNLFYMRQYYSHVSMVDDGVGQVIAKLEEKGVLNDTLFIYTADHGLSNGQHGFWGHGEDTWPSNTHREANNIPLIVKNPNAVHKGKVSKHLVGTTDICSTILDYANLQFADEIPRWMRSLRPLVESSSVDWEDCVFMEQEETRSIRTPQWLFMYRFNSDLHPFESELYDLTRDPNERENKVTDPGYSEVVDELTAKLERFFETYSNLKWNLWKGGTAKSNSTRAFLWRDTWGTDWMPEL